MKILAIETATDACSAALLVDNEIAVEYELAPRKHTQLILPMIEKLMATAQLTMQALDAIAFGQGPGAFTGLRIAAGVTHGLALSADLPVIPVSTLAAMAQQSYHDYQASHILVALDARINEVYWGQYEIIEDKARLYGASKEQIILPDHIEPVTENHWIGVGSGWKEYQSELQSKTTEQLIAFYPNVAPSAEYIAQLAAYEYQQGNTVPVEEAQPVYLRDKVAETVAERRNKNAR